LNLRDHASAKPAPPKFQKVRPCSISKSLEHWNTHFFLLFSLSIYININNKNLNQNNNLRLATKLPRQTSPPQFCSVLQLPLEHFAEHWNRFCPFCGQHPPTRLICINPKLTPSIFAPSLYSSASFLSVST
jgi:hypothetical protein